MKDIVLPVNTDSSIDLSAINETTKGIIIVYNNDGFSGYITCGEQQWFYNNNIDSMDFEYAEYNLIDLINTLVAKNSSTRFKLMEFNAKIK